jgi:hypothetical protein
MSSRGNDVPFGQQRRTPTRLGEAGGDETPMIAVVATDGPAQAGHYD